MKTKKITITIPTDLLKKLKAESVKDGRSLSNCIARKLATATADNEYEDRRRVGITTGGIVTPSDSGRKDRVDVSAVTGHLAGVESESDGDNT